VLCDIIQGITKPAIRRLAREGGVKRVSGLVYEETRFETSRQNLVRTGLGLNNTALLSKKRP
jgi:histone H3/H4